MGAALYQEVTRKQQIAPVLHGCAEVPMTDRMAAIVSLEAVASSTQFVISSSAMRGVVQ